MKGHEIINRFVRDEMPDIERIRDACHKQAISKPMRSTNRMRWSTLAATVTACLFLTTAVAAAGHYFGSFERLREIIGQDRADTLTPLEIVLSVDDFFLSGFRGELVAVGGAAGNVIDVFLTLEDMTGSRLDAHFDVFSYLMYDSPPSGWAQFSEIINRTDCGIVTMHTRHIFNNSVSGQELIFGLQSIRSNFRSNAFAPDFDLGTLTEQMPAAQLWNTPILPPHLHDIDIASEGFENAGKIRISSMGLINGRLHIQEQYDLAALNRWTGNKVHLLNPQGEVVHPVTGTYDNTAGISFRIDGQGNFYNDRGYNFVVDFPFRENIFIVDVARLSEYRLVAPLSVYDESFLGWRAGFEMEMPHAQERVLEGLDITLERYGSIIHTVQITPLTVMISASTIRTPEDMRIGLSAGYGDNFTQPSIQLRTADGIMIEVSHGWVGRYGLDSPAFIEMMLIDREPIDLDTINAIIINGEEIVIN